MSLLGRVPPPPPPAPVPPPPNVPPPPPIDSEGRSGYQDDVTTVPSTHSAAGSVSGGGGGLSSPLGHLPPEKRREWVAKAQKRRTDPHATAVAYSVSDVSDPNIWLELVGRWLVDITTADTLAMLVSIAHKIASSIQEWKHTLVEAGADRKALAKLSEVVVPPREEGEARGMLSLTSSLLFELGCIKGQVQTTLADAGPTGRLGKLAQERDEAIHQKAAAEALAEEALGEKERLLAERENILLELRELQEQTAALSQEYEKSQSNGTSLRRRVAPPSQLQTATLQPAAAPLSSRTEPVVHSRGRTAVVKHSVAFGTTALLNRETKPIAEASTGSGRLSYYRPWLVNARPAVIDKPTEKGTDRKPRSASVDARIHVPAPAKPALGSTAGSVAGSSVRSRSQGPKVLTYTRGRIIEGDGQGTGTTNRIDRSPIKLAHRVEELFTQKVFTGADLY